MHLAFTSVLLLLFPHTGLYFLEDSAELFHYLSQAGCLKDKSLNDKELYNSVMVSVLIIFRQRFSKSELKSL